MLKRTSVLFVILAVLTVAAGCDVVPGPLLSEASPSPTAVRNVLATRPAALPSPIPLLASAIPAPTSIPELIPTQAEIAPTAPALMPTASSEDNFCCLYFAGGPAGQAAETFPAGTEIVYAVWDYTEMTPEDRIRRIWIRDNLIWITREETWDWEKYGASGTIRDLSIFDFEGSGLQPAEYRLQLYLNDDLQQENAFIILPP